MARVWSKAKPPERPMGWEWSKHVPPAPPWVISRPGAKLQCGACDFRVVVGEMAMPDWVDGSAPWGL